MSAPAGVERAGLAEMVEEFGAEFVAELLDDLARDGGARLAQMRAALRAGDAQALARAAHSLKSMGRTLGFERMGTACAALEELARRGELARGEGPLRTIEAELASVPGRRPGHDAGAAA